MKPGTVDNGTAPGLKERERERGWGGEGGRQKGSLTDRVKKKRTWRQREKEADR